MQRITVKGERHPVGGPGQFVLGRAEELCAMLLPGYRERVRLIYLDPPFGTGDTFSMRVGKKQSVIPTYTDVLDEAAYTDMMRTVLTACREMLTPDGSLYLHVDYRKSAPMRLLLDEIFGPANFVNEIIWSYKSGGRSTRHFARKHDTILFYRKSAQQFFNIAAVGVPRGPQRRNHMRQGIDEDGRIFYSIKTGGKIYTYYEDSLVYPTDVWNDIEHLHQRDPERTGYNTQKPEALLARIIDASSEVGDLVMDLFAGSGTTAAVAAQKDRAWVAADASPLALATLRRRMLNAHRAFSLFDATHAMALAYPAGDPLDADLRVAYGEEVRVGPGELALDYLAVGQVEDGIFLPQAHIFSPQPDDTLSGEPGAVVQAVDLYGRQGFWAL